MSDLIERLRELMAALDRNEEYSEDSADVSDAIDALESQAKRIAELEAALRDVREPIVGYIGRVPERKFVIGRVIERIDAALKETPR